jgi:hypothetical protein
VSVIVGVFIGMGVLVIVAVGDGVDVGEQDTNSMISMVVEGKKCNIFMAKFLDNVMSKEQAPNGLRYPRWGGRRNAVRLEKC